MAQTYQINAPLTGFQAISGFMNRLRAGLAARIEHNRARQEVVAELHQFSEQELAGLGIRSADIEFVAGDVK